MPSSNWSEGELKIGPNGLLYRVFVAGAEDRLMSGGHVHWLRCVDPAWPCKGIQVIPVSQKQLYRDLTLLDELALVSAGTPTDIPEPTSHLDAALRARLAKFAVRSSTE